MGTPCESGLSEGGDRFKRAKQNADIFNSTDLIVTKKWGHDALLQALQRAGLPLH
jgi:hypothetical protein